MNYKKAVTQMVVIILWFFLSVLLIAFFPVGWGRALVHRWDGHNLGTALGLHHAEQLGP